MASIENCLFTGGYGFCSIPVHSSRRVSLKDKKVNHAFFFREMRCELGKRDEIGTMTSI